MRRPSIKFSMHLIDVDVEEKRKIWWSKTNPLNNVFGEVEGRHSS